MTFVEDYTPSLCNLNVYSAERHGFSPLVILGQAQRDPGTHLPMSVTMDAASSAT
ncbi:hypothetical protein [Prosthecochloris sp.]|uniref:hypothetical protein n=1 Tax=Prosthecochloris sp. TaxID=290513 RepID=UPI0025F50113|nr:hypothetical protein [Prosthecochloris sp.]